MAGPETPSRIAAGSMEMCSSSSVPSSRGASLSSFAAPSSTANGGSKTSNVRVVARVRPALVHERHRRTCLLPLKNDEDAANETFATPAKAPSQRQDLQTKATPLIRNTAAARKSSSSTPRNPFASVTNVYGNATSMVASKGDVSKEYVYDAVFAPEATQKEVYDRSVGDAVRRNIFRGYNTTIIAYGQSGSGKTYTMSGQKEADKMAPSPPGSSFLESFNFDEAAANTDYKLCDDDGIIPRAVHDLFKAKKRHESAGEVSITLTYLEIYNEELRDLLVDEQLGESSLKIRDSAEDGFFVGGLTSAVVTSAKHARELMDAATTRRRTASTKLNERSSRSHAICTLMISISPAMNSQTTSVDTIGSRGSEIITAKLTMVDLAGSERIKQSGVTGMAKKESININKDLFVLAKVVSALSENAKKKTHVPYRDSKLTRLLRDSLGGNCCTVVVACVSPSDLCFEESINTLRYAERTRAITNSVKQNVTKAALTPAESAALRGENKVLKTRLLEIKKRVRLLEESGGKDGFYHNVSLEDSRGSYDNLYTMPSGETDGSTVNYSSSFEGRLDLDIEEKKVKLERLNRKLSESELMLRSKGSLMDQSTEEYAVKVEVNMDDVSASENRIGRSLKKENDNLRKQNKELMDNIRSMEAEMKSLAATVSNRKAELQDEIKHAEMRRDTLRQEIHRMEERQAQGSYQNSRFRSMTQSAAAGGQLIEMSMMSSEPKVNTTTELQRLQRILKETKHELETGNAKLSAASTRVLELEKMESLLRKQFDELREDKVHDRKYRDQSISDLETLMKETDKLKKERDQARIQAAIHKDDEHKLEGTVRTKDALIAELRWELTEARENLAKFKSSHAVSAAGAAAVEQDLMDTVSIASGSLHSVLTDDPVFSNKTGSIADDGSSTHIDIRVHAAKMLFYANQAIEKGRSSRSVASSFASSNATDFKPDVRHLQTINKLSGVSATGKPPRASRPDEVENQVVISNMDHVATDADTCACQNSLFSGNTEHAEFYLPKLGMACTCGKHKQETATLDGVDPTSLTNILRPWQVKFLKSLEIVNGVDLVHAYNQRGGELSKAMRKWRREQKLPSVKTKSCHIALHIWSRTCKAVVRSVRKQKAEGAKIFKRPDFLEIPSDTRTISTLGYGSVIDLKSEMMEV